MLSRTTSEVESDYVPLEKMIKLIPHRQRPQKDVWSEVYNILAAVGGCDIGCCHCWCGWRRRRIFLNKNSR